MDQRLNQGSSETRVTQQEAAEMIELWTRMREANDSTVALTDVQEVLHISDAEAKELLRAVRTVPEPIAPAKPVQKAPVLLWVMLAVSIYVAATFAWWIVHLKTGGSIVAKGDEIGASLCTLWVVGWIWYLRRPVSSWIASVFSRVVRGRS